MTVRCRTAPLIAATGLLWLWQGSAAATTLGWWRFENSPGFVVNSVAAGSLSIAGDAHALALPASGRGSFFPHGFTPAGGDPNLQAAEVDGAGDTLSTTISIPSGDMTVECFVHLDTATGVPGKTLVAYESGTNPAIANWVLQVRLDGAGGTQPRELAFGGNTGPSTLIFIASGLILELGKDYYVAASFDLASPPQVTFYVQNLTDGGPLQVAVRSHPGQALVAGAILTIGGSFYSPFVATDGLIDEVRVSSHVVPASELLISQIASPPPVPFLPGPALPLVGVALGWIALRGARRVL